MSRQTLYLFILFISINSNAQETLSEIEVSTDKLVTPYHFGTTTRISAEELKNQPLPSLSHVIERSAGIVSTQNGGPGGRTSFFIRGTEARHVSFTLDGLKLNDPSNTDRQFDAAFFSLPVLEDIQIHKGPQAVLFGSDAMGGHIEMRSRKGGEANSGKVSFNGGSLETKGLSISQDWGNKKNKGTVSVGRLESAGISRLNKKRFNAKEKDSSISTQVTSSSTHLLNEKLETDLLFGFIRGENELDGAVTDNKNDKSKNDQYLVQQKTSFKPVKKMNLSLRSGMNRHQRKLKTEAVGQESFNGAIYQNELLFQRKMEKVLVSTGLSNEREVFKTSSLDKAFDLNSIFVQSLLKLSPLEFQAGLRAENHSQYGNFITGSTGAKITFSQTELSTQYSKGFKSPSLYQLYAEPIFGFPIGNKELQPETNQAVEVSLKNKSDILELELTAFQNKLSNLITFSNAGYRNQGSFKTQGLEAGYKLKGEKLIWSASVTHQKFSDEKAPILRRPINLLQSSLSLFIQDSTELYIIGRYFSSRKDLDTNGDEVKLNPFATFDLGIYHNFGQHEVSLKLVNIMDREYEELYGYSVMPRSIFASYGIKY